MSYKRAMINIYRFFFLIEQMQGVFLNAAVAYHRFLVATRKFLIHQQKSAHSEKKRSI